MLFTRDDYPAIKQQMGAKLRNVFYEHLRQRAIDESHKYGPNILKVIWFIAAQYLVWFVEWRRTEIAFNFNTTFNGGIDVGANRMKMKASLHYHWTDEDKRYRTDRMVSEKNVSVDDARLEVLGTLFRVPFSTNRKQTKLQMQTT